MAENIPLWKQLEMQGMSVPDEQKVLVTHDENREGYCEGDKQQVTMKVWLRTAIRFRKLVSLMQAESPQKLYGSEILDSMITEELKRYEKKQ